MPHSDLHKKKLSKNLVILALIIGLMSLIWLVTMVKMARADDDLRVGKREIDISTSYLDGRQAHLEKLDQNPEHWWYDDLDATSFDEDGVVKPLKLQNESRLRNTFNHNRSVGGSATITQ